MSIFELIDGTLKTLDIPFYDKQPEFAENAVPPLFIVYEMYDKPQVSGDGMELITQYIITFSVFGTDINETDTTYENMIEALIDNGFVREGGYYTSNNDYPKYYRHTCDFSYDYERT